MTTYTMGSLLRFFVPLGLAACLVSITHAIISSTLAGADDPELAIAAYALGMSLLGLTERPAVLMRQTCSALVKDKRSFRAISGVTWIVIGATVSFGCVICFTPVGGGLFRYVYGADAALVPDIIAVYRWLMWVSVFSVLRCLYHGVIITQMRTKWVTIAMVVRLFVMLGLSQYFIRTNGVSGGEIGAVIFLAGMMIEAAVCYAEGRTLTRKLPERDPAHNVTTKRHVFTFYRPLLLSSLIVVLVVPVLNALLGKTVDVELSIASFAVAQSLFFVIMSVFTYIHQIVLNFYRTSPGLVFRFQWIVCLLPAAIMAALSWTPVGPFVLHDVMGVSGRLADAALAVMQAFVPLALLLTWVDFGNGFLMLFRRTNVFMWSQTANAALSIALLFLLVALAPHWNGVIGPIAITAGSAAELGVVAFALYRGRHEFVPARS